MCGPVQTDVRTGIGPRPGGWEPLVWITIGLFAKGIKIDTANRTTCATDCYGYCKRKANRSNANTALDLSLLQMHMQPRRFSFMCTNKTLEAITFY